MVSVMRRLLGLGPSKAEQIADLEYQLKRESAVLDLMAFRCPEVFRDVTVQYDGAIHYRPGVAMLEMHMRPKKPEPVFTGRYDAEYHSGLYSGV